ncbi:hypothetical protein OIU84_005797 [Salix udensis]|uniref:Uncharacterized protein n=1 Tax=Salix udensis TaxID=889485 RepID=A0AAD6JXQ5_9ROSI|nr:hypothetical protein OIU84_005797 [Salix udensis]
MSMIMDILDTSILIPEGNEASEQGEKACACLKIFMKTYKGSLLQFFDQLLSPMEHMWVVAYGIGVAAAFGGIGVVAAFGWR